MNESQQILARDITEKQLSDNIVSLARALGWLVHRDPTWRATGADPGYPDLTLLSPRGKVLFVELKSERGRSTEAQEEWRGRLVNGGHYYAIWYPSNWLDGSVDEVLKRGATEQRYEAHVHGSLSHEHFQRGEHDHRG